MQVRFLVLVVSVVALIETVASTEPAALIEGSTTTQPLPVTTAPLFDQRSEFYVKDGTNVCLILQFNANLTITSGLKNVTYTINNGTKTYVNGSCGLEQEEITIAWEAVPNLISYLKWVVSKKSSASANGKLSAAKLSVSEITLQFNDGGAGISVKANSTEIQIDISQNNYYTCSSQDINFSPDVTLKLTNLKFAAFCNSTSTAIENTEPTCTWLPVSKILWCTYPETKCPHDINSSHIVTIVAGAAVALIVVVVLIAYLIGRRRHQTGYQSI